MSAFYMTESTRVQLRARAMQAAALAITSRAAGHVANAATYARQAAELQELADRPQPSFADVLARRAA
jgi:hypothetical protein